MHDVYTPYISWWVVQTSYPLPYPLGAPSTPTFPHEPPPEGVHLGAIAGIMQMHHHTESASHTLGLQGM